MPQKRFLCFTAALMLAVLALQPVSAEPKEKSEGSSKSETVYVTKTGKKYHRGSCSYLRSSRIPKDLRQAIDAGYTACSRCRPPTMRGTGRADKGSSESETRSSPTSDRCAATTKKGTRCKRKASKGSSYCWQHGG